MTYVAGSNTLVKVDLLMKEVIRLLDTKAVVFPWANRKYEWQIKQQGDTVRVETFPRINYSSGTTAWADITASTFAITSETLTADQLDQVRVEVTDIEKILSNLDLMTKVAEQFAYAQAQLYDRFVINLAVNGAATANKLYESAAVTINKSNIYSYTEQMRVTLDENNAWEWETVLFVTPNMASIMRQAPEWDGYREGAEARMNGFIWRISGFTVIKSNNIPANKMIAMDRDSVHFVEQMWKTKVTEETKGFRSNILSELIFWGKVFTENGKRIVTLKYT